MLGGKRKGWRRKKDGHGRLGSGRGLGEAKRTTERDCVREARGPSTKV